MFKTLSKVSPFTFLKICVAAAYLFSFRAFAETSDTLMAETGASAFVRTVVGLLTVLGLIFVCAWIARRLGIRPALRRAGAIKFIESMALTQREKVVIVEVRGTWLVLGIAQGNVRLLHHFPATLERRD